MGQAKRRGSFEERQLRAIKELQLICNEKQKVLDKEKEEKRQYWNSLSDDEKQQYIKKETEMTLLAMEIFNGGFVK
jgi:glucosamine 6-phosphate synthetase-like amidotransferase/phosphosugar isomerase protein